MAIESTEELAIEAVGSLNTHDFAFVKLSDGTYSYAIPADRSTKPVNGAKNKTCHAECVMEECMTFVTTKLGSTKTVRRRHWGKYVHLVSPLIKVQHLLKRRSTLPFREKNAPVICTVIERNGDDVTPARVIAFVPQTDEECSLISSVSDRARALMRRHTR